MASARTSRRPAFTLVELLVVIAIIGILGSLTMVAVMRWIERQRHRNTEAMIKTVQETLKRHWSAVIEEAKKEDISPVVLALAGDNRDRARILWIKARLTEAFPTSYYEVAFTPMFFDHGGSKTWVPLIPAERRRYQKTYQAKIQPTATPDRDTEAAACLLAALSIKHGNAVPLELDKLPVPPLDTDGSGAGDGVPELVDGWSRPIAFLRFPTTNDTTLTPPANAPPPGMTTPPWILQPYDPSTFDSNGAKNGDPLDPRPMTTSGAKKFYLPGQLTNSSTWWNGSSKTSGCMIVQEVCRFSLIDPATTPGTSSAKPWSFYTLPIIVSRGQDAAWGIKVIEDNAPVVGSGKDPFEGTNKNPPPSQNPTWHGFADYADMRVYSIAGSDPYLYAKDNIYSHMQAAPQ